ncbi:MAG: SH3 domain-containing protein [Clostridium sp.]|nr:SH3 domain-containing protein [Acetatifactor muris]MCM1500763.1 SH3 domain-containing protein [Clostridium sp.]MCM1559937.1 SH3 domain-containing protein [Butyrivibrio sp.]
MKITKKFKSFTAITLAAAMVFLTANSLPVHAQSISDVSVSKPGYGITNTSDGSGVNVRNAANLTTSSIIKSIPDETRVMIVGQSGDFYKVQYDTNGYYGYVAKRLIDFIPQDHYLKADSSTSSIPMYKSYLPSYIITIYIPNKTYFAFQADLDGWYGAVYGDVSGYVTKNTTILCNY